MPLVKFVGTTGLTAGSTVITLEPDEEGSRQIELGGDELEISGAEFARLSCMFTLEVQGDEANVEVTPADTNVSVPTPPQVQAPSPAAPQPSNTPATPPRTA